MLTRYLGKRFRFVELINDTNLHVPNYLVRRLKPAPNERGRPVSGSRILLLLSSTTRRVQAAREFPAVRIVELLCTGA